MRLLGTRQLTGLMLQILVLASLAPVWARADVETPRVSFEQHEIVLGSAPRQTVLTGFLLGGAVAELAVLWVDAGGVCRLRLYGWRDEAWAPALDATLGPGVLFVDLVDIGGRDRLVIYRRGRLEWFDPDAETERLLLEVAADYDSRHDLEGSPAQAGSVPPRVDITRDLNGDGRDDVVVPDRDGFWISIQGSDASFSEALKLGPPEPYLDEPLGNVSPGGEASDDATSYGDLGITASTLPLYLSRVHQMDYDRDGRSDLVFWNGDHFEVHLQDDDGQFAPVAESFVSEVPFDSEGTYSRAFDFRGQGAASLLFGAGKKTEGTVLHAIQDLNGDGITDLVTLTLSGRSITKQLSVYEVHFGRATTEAGAGSGAFGGTVFAPEAGTVIQPRGKGGAMQPWGYSAQRFEDLDGDGQVESVFEEVNVGLGGIARALVGNSVPINLELYRMEDGAYPEKPTFRKKIRRFAPFAGLGNVFFPPVLMGDVTGDGRADLLVGHSPTELRIFLGEPGPRVFARRPQKVTVSLPSDERKTRLVDLNKDPKLDVLVHETPTKRNPTAPHRVTMLIAR